MQLPRATGDSARMYIVNDVPLIPQQKTMACWFASAQMLIQWKRNRAQATLSSHPDPSQVDETVRIEASNDGLQYEQVTRLAQLLGLRVVPPMSITLAGLERLLLEHGPLWTHGTAHIIVIAGVNRNADKVYVHDPWPPGKGAKEWRSYSRWFIHGDDGGNRGTSRHVQASFLYHP